MKRPFPSIIFSLISVFILIQCSSGDQQLQFSESDYANFKIAEVVDGITIKVPGFLNEMTDIDQSAVFQYGYIEKLPQNSDRLEDEMYVKITEFKKGGPKAVLEDIAPMTLKDMSKINSVNLDVILDSLTIHNQKPVD